MPIGWTWESIIIYDSCHDTGIESMFYLRYTLFMISLYYIVSVWQMLLIVSQLPMIFFANVTGMMSLWLIVTFFLELWQVIGIFEVPSSLVANISHLDRIQR